MSVTVSKRLSNSLEGALAGGGDPATSPLYVFGPFLRLIVVAGVAQVTFGVSIWMAVFSVIVVSALYHQVMYWVTDGSGGSGLSEEEFGSWAVKITAGITVIEYVLTYLVSMAALVTFIVDRFPVLNGDIHGISYRSLVAVVLTAFACWVVNLGPKVSARTFGPATGVLLLLLWAMIFASIYTTGFHLPDFNLHAFSLSPVTFTGPEGKEETSTYLHLTFGGYARILALMTGIEIFANLVAAYDGTRAERSRKAFGSLLIIMGTTVITMIIVGPVILAHSDPLNEQSSVFTQAMDYLFTPSISYLGTLIGVTVLLSASAAAAQAIQNLALGLRYRHYVPAKLGQRNAHDVADIPVWIMAGFCSACFILFGTREDTYLALYAAGVFILLSMTGWAACKRLIRELHSQVSVRRLAMLIGSVFSALLTSFATLVIFEERFFEGAWAYFFLMPIFYALFTYYRRQLGPPPSVEERLGRVIAGQMLTPEQVINKQVLNKKADDVYFKKILMVLDDTYLTDQQLLPLMRFLSLAQGTEVELLLVNNNLNRSRFQSLSYLRTLANAFGKEGLTTNFKITDGDPALLIDRRAVTKAADVIVLTTAGNSPLSKYISNADVEQVIQKTLIPTLILHRNKVYKQFTHFKRILVALDGSEASESVLLYIRTLARGVGSSVFLLSVPEGSESDNYEATIRLYLENIAKQLKGDGIETTIHMTGSGPARTILGMALAESADLIVMASHGRGGIERPTIHMGSVTEKVIQKAPCPLFIVPLTKKGYFT